MVFAAMACGLRVLRREGSGSRLSKAVGSLRLEDLWLRVYSVWDSVEGFGA